MALLYYDIESGDDGFSDFSRYGVSYQGFNSDGTAFITNAFSKFGGGSLAMTGGSTGAGSNVRQNMQTGWSFPAGVPFTVEAQGYLVSHSATAVEQLIGCWQNTASSLDWCLGFTSSGQFAFRYSTTGTDSVTVGAAQTPTLSTWVHYAVDRDSSGVIRVYVGGTMIASATYTGAINQATALPLCIGNDWGQASRWPGYIDEVRLTYGVARYASNAGFTPPTAAFGNSVAEDLYFNAVHLLMHFDGNGSGTSFQNRRRYLNNASQSAGDVVRIKASPPPTLVGNATWTQYSKDIVLSSAVTQMIADCDTNWTPANGNVTCALDTGGFKQGTASVTITIAAAFTTGKAAYKAIGSTLDLTAFKQLSYWFQSNLGTIYAGAYSLCLCSDVTGDVVVHRIPMDTNYSQWGTVVNRWIPAAVEFPTNFSSGIQSVALYVEFDMGAVTIKLDNIFAAKASSAPDSLTLHSLLGKAQSMYWEPSTAYSVGDKRSPTGALKNGYCYQVTTAGTSGGTEPAWGSGGLGVVVNDGSIVWTCVDLEDTWYAIQSIVGTTVKIDNQQTTLATAGRGYSLATETVATYKREPVIGVLNTGNTSGTSYYTNSANGTVAAPITFSGGWDRTAMATQTDLTFMTARFNASVGWAFGSNNIMRNLGAVRCDFGINVPSGACGIYNCHANHFSTAGFYFNTSAQAVTIQGAFSVNGYCNSYGGFGINTDITGAWRAISSSGHLNSASGIFTSSVFTVRLTDAYLRNNQFYGLFNNLGRLVPTMTNVKTGNNGTAALYTGSDQVALNCTFPEATLAPTNTMMVNFGSMYFYSHNNGGVAGSHLITTDGGKIESATDQRHTASGMSWKFSPTSTNRHAAYPLRLSVAKIACAANTPVNVSIWTRRSATTIQGKLVLAGGQIAGVSTDVSVPCAPAINGWEQSATLSFTPTEAGVVELTYLCWDGTAVNANMWIDDLTVS